VTSTISNLGTPKPIDDSNEEWVAHAKRPTQSIVVQLNEGVHMEIMLEHLVQPTFEMNRAQQIETSEVQLIRLALM
jgi:hypothetical protein